MNCRTSRSANAMGCVPLLASTPVIYAPRSTPICARAPARQTRPSPPVARMGRSGDLPFNFSQRSQSQWAHIRIVSFRTGFKYFHVKKDIKETFEKVALYVNFMRSQPPPVLKYLRKRTSFHNIPIKFRPPQRRESF